MKSDFLEPPMYQYSLRDQIFMAVLPGMLAQHTKDEMYGSSGEENRRLVIMWAWKTADKAIEAREME